MGIVSDEFARARADRWVPKHPRRPKQPTYCRPFVVAPVRGIGRFFGFLGPVGQKEARKLAYAAKKGEVTSVQLQQAYYRLEEDSRYATKVTELASG